MLLTIVVIVVILAVVLIVYAASKPNTFRLERNALIEASPETVYGYLEDFHLWPQWSPWEKLDADLGRTHGGAEKGLGAIYSWEGRKAGCGRMEITEARPGEKVLIKLDFIKPMKANNIADFTLQPEGGGTRIVWAMYGPQPFASKVMTNFISMDKLVGGQFEEGLANLKRLSEA